MKRFLLLALTAGLMSPIAAKAEVDPKIHKMCLQAKDYLGCVQAQKNGTNPSPTVVIDGGVSPTGNACPLGFAYSGNGYCREVTCVMTGDNHLDLGGKDHACGNAPFWSGWIGRMILDWGKTTVRATLDPSCPTKPPEIGWRSSCTQALGSDVKPHYVGGVPPKKKNKKPLACRNGTWSPNHPQCKESESAITSPMDMD